MGKNMMAKSLLAVRIGDAQQHLRRKDIADLLGMTPARLNYVKNLVRSPVRSVVPPSKDPDTIEQVIQTVKELGLQRLSVKKVAAALQQKEGHKQPSNKVVRTIFKDRLGIKYRSFNSANLRYNDEKFDDKRLVVSRLLAQVMKNDCLLISIDEAHFNHIQYQRRSWQPSQKGRGVQQMDSRCRVLFEEAGLPLAARAVAESDVPLMQTGVPVES